MNKTIRDTIALLQPGERRQLLGQSLAVLFITFLDIAALAALLALINFYTGQQAATPGFLHTLLPEHHALLPFTALLLLFLMKNLLGFFIFRSQSRFNYAVALRMARNQLLHFLNGPFTESIEVNHARQQHSIHHQPIEFAHHVLFGLQQIFTEIVLILCIMVVLCLYNPLLFLLLLVVFLPPVLIAVFYANRKIKHIKANLKDDAHKTIQYLDEALDSFVETSIYNKQDFFVRRFFSFQQKMNRHLSNLQLVQWVPSKLAELFSIIGLLLIIGLSQAFELDASLINIGIFTAAAYKIIPGVVKIANLGTLVKTYRHTVYDLAAPGSGQAEESGQPAPITSIAIRELSFSYRQKPVLQQCSATLAPGDFAWITGSSGKGKTTLINLLLGFLEENDGSILFNNEVQTPAMRRKHHLYFSYVRQQHFLLNDTLAHNIALENKDIDEPRLLQAIQLSGLSPVIAGKPEGIHTLISENGKNFSGGQRQRIALARALYKEAPVIILDEPFNELDEASERELHTLFRNIAATGKIVLLLSHSSFSMEYCNKKIDLDA